MHAKFPVSGQSVEATLKFMRPQEAAPYFESAALTGGDERFHFEVETHRVRVQNLRNASPRATVAENGFQLLSHRSSVKDLRNDSEVASNYLPEVEALVAEALNATRAVAFDVTRRSDAADGAANRDGQRKPAGHVHVDYTIKSGPQRAADVLGAEFVNKHLEAGGSIVQVNAWRPIQGPVLRTPLAVADASSIDPSHLVATEQIFPDRVGEIYHLHHSPEQRWFYVPEMQSNEVLLLKSWDSREGGTRFTPHAAFSLPNEPADAVRESIEVRTFAVIAAS